MNDILQQRVAKLRREVSDHELALASHYCNSLIMSVHDMTSTRMKIRTCKGTIREINEIMKKQDDEYLERCGREDAPDGNRSKGDDSSTQEIGGIWSKAKKLVTSRPFRRKARIKIL